MQSCFQFKRLALFAPEDSFQLRCKLSAGLAWSPAASEIGKAHSMTSQDRKLGGIRIADIIRIQFDVFDTEFVALHASVQPET